MDVLWREVTPENLLRVLTNRHPPGTPRSKKMLTDSGSNLLFFLTGHGGDEFIKFQDQFELMSKDVADALRQMREKIRYNEVLFIAETCQAATMAAQFYSPNVLSLVPTLYCIHFPLSYVFHILRMFRLPFFQEY